MIYERPVQLIEVDIMGIVHHSHYVRYLEETRLDIMNQMGFGYEKLMAMGLNAPVMNLNIHYLHPARYPDTLCIEAHLVFYDGVRFRFTYQLTNQATGEAVAEAETEHCLVGAAGIPARIRSRYPEVHAFLTGLLETNQNAV